MPIQTSASRGYVLFISGNKRHTKVLKLSAGLRTHPAECSKLGKTQITKGYVEYTIPNLIPSNQRITQLSISAELSSEAPGIDNNWPSDISFYINDTKIGMWTSPGDFGDVHGMFTPQWWPQNWNQYGLLKLLVINDYGTYIDGLKISDVSTLSLHLDYSSDIHLRLAVENDSEHVGGITLYGKSFGNYDQDIRVAINYAPLVAAQP